MRQTSKACGVVGECEATLGERATVAARTRPRTMTPAAQTSVAGRRPRPLHASGARYLLPHMRPGSKP